MHEMRCKEFPECKGMQEVRIHWPQIQSKRTKRGTIATTDSGREVCILRMEGTNNEFEAFNAFLDAGCEPHFIHLNMLRRKEVSLEQFNCLFLPGGFSAGDYIRAGSIFASRLRESSFSELKKFVDSGKPVIGVCNGFQVLSELGILPGHQDRRTIALDHNDSNRYECRLTYIRRVSGNPIFRSGVEMNHPYVIPVAHAEGKILTMDHRIMERMIEEKQILFKYSDPEGNDGEYPWNPNGTPDAIAGISNPSGNVIGLMPHPERLFDREIRYLGDSGSERIGQAFFKDLSDYMVRF